MTLGDHKIKVAVVLPELGGGGAQRTFLNVLNHLDRELFDPILVLYRPAGSFRSLLKSDVKIVTLDSVRTLWSILPLARWIRSESPDVVMSTLLHINVATVISGILSRKGVPVVVRESNNLTAAGRPLRTLSGMAVRWAYRRAETVIALSKGVRRDVIDRYSLKKDRVRMIYNPIDLEAIQSLSMEKADPLPGWTDDSNEHRIIAVGRLVPQKGFELLIEAVSQLDAPWRLLIIGEGIEDYNLKALAKNLGISKHVIMPGFIANPFPYIAMADLFVLSSRWEGFGHVIPEAMACGTPVVATGCPSGPDEIIEEGIDGQLCEPGSSNSLTSNIECLLKSPDIRDRMANTAKVSVQRFSAGEVIRQYEILFKELSSDS